jgi:hypothetical protein
VVEVDCAGAEQLDLVEARELLGEGENCSRLAREVVGARSAS